MWSPSLPLGSEQQSEQLLGFGCWDIKALPQSTRSSFLDAAGKAELVQDTPAMSNKQETSERVKSSQSHPC